MEILQLPVVDLYPVSEPDFGGLIRFPRILKSADDYADLIGECRSHGAMQSEVSETLSRSKAFKQCKQSMQRLKDVPNINRYRNHPDNYCSKSLQNELVRNGYCLAPNQKLFHGGIFPLLDTTKKPLLNKEFVLTKPLSTTFCAMIAGAHSDTHSTRHLWVITVSEQCKMPVYVFSNAQNQVHGRELEVLFGAGLTVKCVGVRSNSHYDILEVVVT